MNDLTQFEPPQEGHITLCEIDGKVQSMCGEFCNVKIFTGAIDKHPQVHITREMLHPTMSGDEGRALFLPVSMPFLKQLILVYYEQGVLETLHFAAGKKQFLISKCAEFVLKAVEQYNRLKIIFNPHIRESGTKLINKLSLCRNWETNVIRCLAWHPYSNKIAVATCDDNVRVYASGNNVAPILRCKRQRNITCLAWRPLSNSEIAVGCESGIFIWNVDPNYVVTRPSSSSAIILQRVEHRPVMCLCWSPKGDILASAAACNSSILMWDVEMDRTSSLKRPGSYGNTMVEWSPRGDKMFSLTVGIVFRVWECQTWRAERWNVLSGRVQTACWSPCGNILLFATNEEPKIYGLSFLTSKFAFITDTDISPNHAIPLYDLTKIDLNGYIIGGLVQNMIWDPKGKHIAVLFQDTNCIALFTIVTVPAIQLIPSSLIVGLPEETPAAIAFQKNFDSGSCLSIAWSSGRVQHFPIIFSDLNSPEKSPGQHLHNISFRSNDSMFY